MTTIRAICRGMFAASALVFFSAHAQASGDGYSPPISVKQETITYTVNRDGTYRKEEVRAVRVENEQGVEGFGDTNIAYTPGLENLKIEQAYTRLPDGTRIKVPASNIRTTNDDLNRGGATYSDRKHKVIIFPSVTVGSQLYIHYVKTVHTPLFPGQFSFIKYTGSMIRYGRLAVEVNYDPAVHVDFHARGFKGGRLPDRNGMHRYRYTYSQDTALAPEPGQVSGRDFAPYVEGTTFSSYADLGRAYEKKAAGKVRVTPAIRKLADRITKHAHDKKAQARLLYNWVSSNIRYVGSYVGNGGYVPHDAQTILGNRWGDCKDHVVILAALLKAKGIDSSPALINADDSYVLPKLPVVDAFNHLITYVQSMNLYLDSTAQFAPFGTLPEQDMDKEVVLTALKRTAMTPMELPDAEHISSEVHLQVMPNGTIRGSSKTRASGDLEIMLRGTLFSIETQPQDQVVNAILDARGLSGSGQIHSSDPQNLDKPITVSTTFTLDPISNFPGPAAMPIPGGIAYGVINRRMLPKPLAHEHFPSKCESFSYSNRFEIRFPASVHIRHIPDDVNYKDANGSYTATYRLSGNTLKVERHLVASHPTMVCSPASNELDKKFFPVFQRDMRAQVIYD